MNLKIPIQTKVELLRAGKATIKHIDYNGKKRLVFFISSEQWYGLSNAALNKLKELAAQNSVDSTFTK